MKIRIFGEPDEIRSELAGIASNATLSEFSIVRYASGSNDSQGIEINFSILPDLAKVRDMLARLVLRPIEIEFKGHKIKVADKLDLPLAMAAIERLEALSKQATPPASSRQTAPTQAKE